MAENTPKPGSKDRELDEENRPAKVEEMDPDAPARSLFDEDEDAVEPNEPA